MFIQHHKFQTVSYILSEKNTGSHALVSKRPLYNFYNTALKGCLNKTVGLEYPILSSIGVQMLFQWKVFIVKIERMKVQLKTFKFKTK